MRIGILAFADSPDAGSTALADWLRERGHIVVEGEKGVSSGAAAAASETERLARADCEAVVFSFDSWVPSGLAVQAALRASGPILLTGSSEAAFFGAAEALLEVGTGFGRALGSIADLSVQALIEQWLRLHAVEQRQRGEAAAQKLYGTRCGAFGSSPSVGSPTVDAARWLSQFGVYYQPFGLREVAAWSRQVAPERVEAGLIWLQAQCKEIRYDGRTLTPGVEGTLARQMRLYLAVKDCCAHEQIEFCTLAELWDGSGDGGMTAVSPMLPAALLNNNVDSEGDKKPVVCATGGSGGGGDANGALTMQLLHHIAEQQPVLSAEIGSCRADSGLIDLIDTGASAFGVARLAENADGRVMTLVPAPEGDGALGAAITLEADAVAAVPEVTFARITRRSGRFVCVIAAGEIVCPAAPGESERRAMQAQFHGGGLNAFLNIWSSPRIHAVSGDHVGALKAACEALDIEPILL